MKKSFRFLAFAALAAMTLFSCEKEPKAETATVDFEGAYWSALIDNPQYGGTLIYGTSYDETTWTWSGAEGYTWTDSNTTLGFDGFPDAWGSRCFSSGGEVISNYVVADFTGALERLSPIMWLQTLPEHPAPVSLKSPSHPRKAAIS